MKRKMYIFITIIIIFSISLVWIIKACNNRKQSEFETESIISDDHVKITKLTSENFNIIKESIESAAEIKYIDIYYLDDNDVNLELLSEIEIPYFNLEINIFVDSDKTLEGISEIPESIAVNIYGYKYPAINLSGINNVRYLQIYNCKIDENSNWGSMKTLESAILYGSDINGLGDCSKLENFKKIKIDRTGCYNNEQVNLSGLDTLKNEIKIQINFDFRCNISQKDINSLSNVDISELQLTSNKNLDLSVLKNVSVLRLRKIEDVDWLELNNMSNLKKIDISGTDISDLTPVASLTNIEELDISNINVTDLSPLKDMPNLKKLIAENCNIDDWSPVSDIDEVIK